jgi:hypothetical protein
MLKVHFDSLGDYRAYWQKYKSTAQPERWYRTLLDDQAGRKQWMQAARNILARTDGTTFYLSRNAPIPNATNHYTYAGQSLRSKAAPSVGELFLKRALAIAPTNFSSSQDAWSFQDAADLGLMLAEWDARNATPALEKIIHRCPAFFFDQPEIWTTGCAVVPVQFARLAVALAKLGDNSGLDLYAKWVRDSKLSDLHDALPVALSPLGDFPNHPSIKEASAHLFQMEKGDWIGQRHPDLLDTRLLLNGPFRLLVLSALTNKARMGAIVLKEKDQFEYTSDHESGGGLLKPDSFAPKLGEAVSYRVCDDVAHRLSRIEGLPVLQLYWPQDKRDEAVAGIIKFLQDHGANLKLKPAP